MRSAFEFGNEVRLDLEILKCNNTAYVDMEDDIYDMESLLANLSHSNIYRVVGERVINGAQNYLIAINGFEWMQDYLKNNVQALSGSGLIL